MQCSEVWFSAVQCNRNISLVRCSVVQCSVVQYRDSADRAQCSRAVSVMGSINNDIVDLGETDLWQGALCCTVHYSLFTVHCAVHIGSKNGTDYKYF